MSGVVSPMRMKKIDRTSYDLYQKYIKHHIGRSLKKTTALREELEKGPMPGNKNPVIKKIIRNGSGTWNFNAAMMTWGYLAAMLRYREKGLLKTRSGR